MPRKRKTMTGADAQEIKSVPGQRYGEGVDQQAMQRAMPAPDNQQPTPPEVLTPTITDPMVDAPSDPGQITQFLANNNPNLLSGTQMPDQPLTAGLSMGPGGGPETLGLGAGMTPLARTLRTLSDQTGNPRWRELAQKARM